MIKSRFTEVDFREKNSLNEVCDLLFFHPEQ